MKKTDLYELSYELKRQLRMRIIASVLSFVFLCIFITLVLNFFIFPVRQKSASMEPSVSPGACIMISRLYNEIKRGELILVQPKEAVKIPFALRALDYVTAFFTGQQIFPFAKARGTETPVLRRAIGLPGDTIYMKDYVLYIKPAGQQYFLTEFEYMKTPYQVSIDPLNSEWDSALGSIGNFDPVFLDKDEYFVLGDNRTCSLDSRLWESLSRRSIVGKGLFQYFPLSGMRIF
ncbi:signal peptidase I [Treponema parvum]|uniref:signal peptidase I n=1 Tax=Treponema parvum TaxID=138851 RepID=UPI001AEC3BE9|nr:signal peptidase I [Treponema parvum]QTQ16323.1 signal peptidase I [Treponema parvum]